MTSDDSGERITQLLRSWQQGDAQSAEEVVPLVYAELRRIARIRLSAERSGHTLQPTALVHEAWLRLMQQHGANWQNRAQFFAIAAQAMRRILVDQARRKLADKRSHGRRVPLDAADVRFTSPADDLLDIDDALTRLAAEDAQAARLVQLRYFTGLSIEDAAEVVGLSRSTAYAHWSYARVRLKTLLDGQ